MRLWLTCFSVVAAVTAFVNSNFTHPGALIVQSCPSTSACTASGNFSAMSTVAGAPTTVVPAPGINNQTVTAGLGIFLPDNDGAGAFTGLDTARITLTVTDTVNNKVLTTVEIRLDTPQGETVQNAVRLTLATAAAPFWLSLCVLYICTVVFRSSGPRRLQPVRSPTIRAADRSSGKRPASCRA